MRYTRSTVPPAAAARTANPLSRSPFARSIASPGCYKPVPMNHLKELALALFTMAVLAVTFYFPMYGLGLALDHAKNSSERWEGVGLLLPSAALLVFLAGMYPAFRGTGLLCLGAAATLLLVPTAIVFARSGTPPAYYCMAAIAYSAVWWLLAQPRIWVH